MGAGVPPTSDHCVNRFPAHAYCSLTWFFEDAPVVVRPIDDAWLGRALPHVLFSDPRSRPLITRHTGRMRALTLVLYPQAVHALTGLPVAEHIDRFTPLDEVLPEPWHALSRQVLDAAGADERVAWAGIAADAGFADQAHLSREMREITGDSPRDWARRLVDDDEGYWAYRIWC